MGVWHGRGFLLVLTGALVGCVGNDPRAAEGPQAARTSKDGGERESSTPTKSEPVPGEKPQPTAPEGGTSGPARGDAATETSSRMDAAMDSSMDAMAFVPFESTCGELTAHVRAPLTASGCAAGTTWMAPPMRWEDVEAGVRELHVVPGTSGVSAEVIAQRQVDASTLVDCALVTLDISGRCIDTPIDLECSVVTATGVRETAAAHGTYAIVTRCGAKGFPCGDELRIHDGTRTSTVELGTHSDLGPSVAVHHAAVLGDGTVGLVTRLSSSDSAGEPPRLGLRHYDVAGTLLAEHFGDDSRLLVDAAPGRDQTILVLLNEGTSDNPSYLLQRLDFGGSVLASWRPPSDASIIDMHGNEDRVALAGTDGDSWAVVLDGATLQPAFDPPAIGAGSAHAVQLLEDGRILVLHGQNAAHLTRVTPTGETRDTRELNASFASSEPSQISRQADGSVLLRIGSQVVHYCP